MNKGQVLLERSLSDLQDNTVKLQVAFADGDGEMPAELDIVHHEHIGRVHTYIVRGNREEMIARVAALNPILLEAIPLTLEEIFIYELGGEDYAVKDIVL
jgi:ABC-2 type transport system ATP-binding protein